MVYKKKFRRKQYYKEKCVKTKNYLLDNQGRREEYYLHNGDRKKKFLFEKIGQNYCT